MPPYSGPSKERANYESKFVRVRSDIYTTIPGDLSTTHSKLAVENNVFLPIAKLKTDDPSEVDGGIYQITKGVIYVRGDSESLQIPVNATYQEAREKTKAAFQALSPEYPVCTTLEALREELHRKFFGDKK